jgi:hypothetical protein
MGFRKNVVVPAFAAPLPEIFLGSVRDGVLCAFNVSFPATYLWYSFSVQLSLCVDTDSQALLSLPQSAYTLPSSTEFVIEALWSSNGTHQTKAFNTYVIFLVFVSKV